MAVNPQPPQERIDALIGRIGTDNQAYTTSVQELQTGFNRRNTDLSDMLTECMRIASNAIELVRQNNQVAEQIPGKLQELESAYAGQNAQLTGDFRELLEMVNRMQNDGQQGTARLRQQLADITGRFEAIQAQVRARDGPDRVNGAPPRGGYNNKKNPKRGGYAYVGSPGKVRTKTRTRTRNRTRRSLAGKASSSKRSSKRSTRRKQKRSRRR
tara:strand:+ start:751 stop:1389 length:639 start_codon:yes stop_codon:yes gene_type:complete